MAATSGIMVAASAVFDVNSDTKVVSVVIPVKRTQSGKFTKAEACAPNTNDAPED